MCGIHGQVALNRGAKLSSELVRRMGDISVHRGPDDEGIYVGTDVILGMRRLSIIDVEGGHQPLSAEDGKVQLVCNGEIYNYRELKSELVAAGAVFKTGSDSEVILHGYLAWGAGVVDRLNGMFAFALWDGRQNKFILVRDRLGIKPLYYYRDNDVLMFASEIKSLLQNPALERQIDPAALEEYLAFGYVPAPRTLFAGIRKLPPATRMEVVGGQIRLHRYWQLQGERTDRGIEEADWNQRVLEQLEKSVAAQMVSDVPIGAFLSGGVDSSAVVGLMAGHASEPVNTFAIGFEGGPVEKVYNELPYARQVAELFGTRHEEIVVKPDVVSLLPKLLWHMDEPIADTAMVTTYLVSEFARKHVKVILCGVGGDELFGGYRRYLGNHYAARYRQVPAWIRQRLIRPLASRLPADRHSRALSTLRYAKTFIESAELDERKRYRSYIELACARDRKALMTQHPAGGADALDRAFDRSGDMTPLQTLMAVDLQTQLPDDLLLLSDKMTMATSLECRVPFLDHELVELAARLPDHLRIRKGTLKYVLKNALGGLLPEDILHRQKRGFGAPMGAWLRKELAETFDSLVNQRRVEARGWLNWPVIEEVIRKHRNQQADYTDLLLALMNLELWAQIYMDGQAAESISRRLQSAA